MPLDGPLEVHSRVDLASYVDELLIELQAHPEKWENATLERYLEALSRYLRDLPGWCKNNEPSIDADQAEWHLFAIALAGAQVYE